MSRFFGLDFLDNDKWEGLSWLLLLLLGWAKGNNRRGCVTGWKETRAGLLITQQQWRRKFHGLLFFYRQGHRHSVRLRRSRWFTHSGKVSKKLRNCCSKRSLLFLEKESLRWVPEEVFAIDRMLENAYRKQDPNLRKDCMRICCFLFVDRFWPGDMESAIGRSRSTDRQEPREQPQESTEACREHPRCV